MLLCLRDAHVVYEAFMTFSHTKQQLLYIFLNLILRMVQIHMRLCIYFHKLPFNILDITVILLQQECGVVEQTFFIKKIIY